MWVVAFWGNQALELPLHNGFPSLGISLGQVWEGQKLCASIYFVGM
jgi:hypothetical protein